VGEKRKLSGGPAGSRGSVTWARPTPYIKENQTLRYADSAHLSAHVSIGRFPSNDTGLLNFRFERVAANSSSKRLECIGVVISSSARDHGHREGFSHAVCGYE